jgi:hypothetical protein
VKNDPVSVAIMGGWVGVLASMLFQSTLPIKHITSVDIDDLCRSTAVQMNKLEEMEGRFTAITADMTDISITADVIINTSCEHLTQNQYDAWLCAMPHDSFIVLQSNNYIIPEHIRTHNSVKEFKETSHINVIWEGELVLPLYTRYMLLGKKI